MSKNTIKISLFPKGSGPGLAALGLAAACLAGWGFNQKASAPDFGGEVQRAWRAGTLGLKEPGNVGFASGDISALTVSDMRFGLRARAALLQRSVSTYQWIETCAGGKCSVSQGWMERVVDAKKFATPGHDNPRPAYVGMSFATSAKVGHVAIGSSASRWLAPLARPYPVGPHNADIPGLFKVDGGYQNFQGQPKPGDFRVTWKAVPVGMAVTIAGEFGKHGELAGAKSSRFIAREGAMDVPRLLGLSFWELPIFGSAMLWLSAALAALGAAGLWSARGIERQILERRQAAKVDRRKKQAVLPAGQKERRQGERREPARSLAKPRDKSSREQSQM